MTKDNGCAQPCDATPHAIISHLLDAMRGVAAAHREGVIHRDIKPDNIFLAREPDRRVAIPKVLDFGISKLADRDGLSLTRTGMTLGTPMYMSYEQLAGVRDIDARTDVYAFGVILYEALTGQSPFNAETFSELIIKITTTLPPTPKALRPSIPGALSSIVETAMRRERAERTPSLDALIGLLEPYSTAEGYASRVTEVADAPVGWAPTMAAPTPVSMPISVPSPSAQQPRTGDFAPMTAGRVAGTSIGGASRPVDAFSEPNDVRISSIPRSFTARTALVWGGIVLVLVAALAWFASRRTPDVAGDPPPPHVVAAPAAAKASDFPRAPAATAVPRPAPTAAEPKPAAAPPTGGDEPKARALTPTASPAAAQVPKLRERKPPAPRPLTTAPAKPAVPTPTEARPKPSAPGPRAGRPQSQEF